MFKVRAEDRETRFLESCSGKSKYYNKGTRSFLPAYNQIKARKHNQVGSAKSVNRKIGKLNRCKVNSTNLRT